MGFEVLICTRKAGLAGQDLELCVTAVENGKSLYNVKFFDGTTGRPTEKDYKEAAQGVAKALKREGCQANAYAVCNGKRMRFTNSELVQEFTVPLSDLKLFLETIEEGLKP